MITSDSMQVQNNYLQYFYLRQSTSQTDLFISEAGRTESEQGII
jgi:hypothetical protein